jgi:MSHA biogenesis protein MshK
MKSPVASLPSGAARWAAALVLVFSASAVAQVTIDPTRPPSGYATAAPEPSGDAAGTLTLQSVLISPSQKAAIISGVTVKLGEKYGDAVLVKVAENEVVLKSAGASQVLKLYPGIEKREVTSTAEKELRGKAGTTAPR